MKQSINPHKALAWAVLIIIYVMLSVALLGVKAPQMLRAADTFLNVSALIAIASWALVTTYFVGILWLHHKRKPTKKGRKRQC